MKNNRAYNMILVERSFGNQKHCFALLGFERSTGMWNLLGGRQEDTDKNRGITASRELYEESAMLLDKRNDISYWSNLTSYEYGAHKVFIHNPTTFDVKIGQMNDSIQKILNNPQITREYKEMEKYKLVRLTDLLSLAKHYVKGQPGVLIHPDEVFPMNIDEWVIYTLHFANLSALNLYKY